MAFVCLQMGQCMKPVKTELTNKCLAANTHSQPPAPMTPLQPTLSNVEAAPNGKTSCSTDGTELKDNPMEIDDIDDLEQTVLERLLADVEGGIHETQLSPVNEEDVALDMDVVVVENMDIELFRW